MYLSACALRTTSVPPVASCAHDTHRPTVALAPGAYRWKRLRDLSGSLLQSLSCSESFTQAHLSPTLHRNKGKRLTHDPSFPPHGARAGRGFLSCWAELPYQMKCLHQLQLQTTHSNDRLAEAVLLSQQKLSKSLSQEKLLKVTVVPLSLPRVPFLAGHTCVLTKETKLWRVRESSLNDKHLRPKASSKTRNKTRQAD